MFNLEIGGENFKLRLTTRAGIALEQKLGYNPVMVFTRTDFDKGMLPKVSDMMIIFHAMLQAQHHGFTLDKTYDLFDRYVEDGHNLYDLLPIFIEVFQNAGLINKVEEEEAVEKN